CIDLLLEDVRRSQALTVGIGKNVEAISVYIQSGLIGNRERAEEAESKAEGCAHDGVDVLSSGHAFLDDRGGFFEEHILQSVQHHSWCICHLRTLVTRLCQHFLDGLDRVLCSGFTCDQLHSGDERCRVGEMDSQETLWMDHGIG